MIKTPRLRIFAGPNGSGKSTMIESLDKRLSKLFLNADILEKELKETGLLNLDYYNQNLSAEKLIEYLSRIRRGVSPFLQAIPVVEGRTINFSGNIIDSYLAARILDHVRFELLDLGVSFTFETVMSHESKIEFMRMAKNRGYKVYLYFLSTEDPEINVSRVSRRVIGGGHAVPADKIRSRYYRTMSLLVDAIEESDRAFLFDNSNDYKGAQFICEISDGVEVVMSDYGLTQTPVWFERYVLNQH